MFIISYELWFQASDALCPLHEHHTQSRSRVWSRTDGGKTGDDKNAKAHVTKHISLFDAPKSPSGLVGHWMSNSNQYEVQRWMYKTPCYPNHRCSSVGNGRENMFLVVVNFTSWYTTQEGWTFSDPSLILCYRSRLRNGKGKHNYTCRSVSNLYKEQLFPAVRHTQ